MQDTHVKNVIEAALLAAGRPLRLEALSALFGEAMRPSAATVRTALEALAAEYAGRGIELKETASGWRVQIRSALAAEISRLWPERPARYSRALLETLALIAYRQPITRGEIEAVRGVAVNPNIVKTLLERNWVRVLGQRDVPGRPELLGTTAEFLDYFGLQRLDDLPPLAELKAMVDFNVQLELDESPAGDEATSGEPAGPTASSAAELEGEVAGDEIDEEEDSESDAEPDSTAGLVAAPGIPGRAPE